MDLSEAQSLLNSDESNSSESQQYFANSKSEESKSNIIFSDNGENNNTTAVETTRSSSSDGTGDEIEPDRTELVSEEFDRRERTPEEPDPALADQGDSSPLV